MKEIGQSMPRLEDDRLLRGQGCYVDDISIDGQGYTAFLRSEIACGQLIRLDLTAARSMPGVRLVIGAFDAPGLGLGHFPTLGEMPNQKSYSRPVMPTSVRHVGEILAMVVADSQSQAFSAVEAIEHEFDAREPVIEIGRGERAFAWQIGDDTVTAEAFKQATWVAEVCTPSNRVIVHPLECRSALAQFDDAQSIFRVWTGSQGSHKIRDMLAFATSVSKDEIHVITPDVGGAFGMKLQAYPEQALVMLAAKLTKQPVKWVGSRQECSLMDAHGRAQHLSARIALDNEGRFLALSIENNADLGAYATGFSCFTPSTSGAKVAGHVYRVPNITISVNAYYTNTAPVDAYRGAGKPEMVYILERAIDQAARISGIDRVEIRRRNLLKSSEMPARLPMGQHIDTGEFPQIFEKAVDVADWRGFAKRREIARLQGRLAGIGVGMHMHVSGGFINERSLILVDPVGNVVIDTGSQSGGQGHNTVFAQIAAAQLQLPLSQVIIHQGDTSRLADGGGTGGSSSLPIAGVNIARACRELIEIARRKAASELEVATGDIEYVRGEFIVVGTDKKCTIFEIAAGEEELTHGCDYEGDHATFPNGAYVAEVEIDGETGKIELTHFVGVDDIGTVVNPLIAMGQIHGGVVQGLGQVLMEEAAYDPAGQLINATLMDYALPRANDLPKLDCQFHPVPATANPLGAKGVGELGPAGALAPVVNAVIDALRSAGVESLDMPVNSESVWRALQSRH